jgi:hypothetical protein
MIVKDENTLVAFVNSNQPPIRTKHICYFTADRGEEGIALCEVIENTYPHPEAPEDAVIPVIDTRVVKIVKRTNYQAAPLILLEANQQTVRMIERKP